MVKVERISGTCVSAHVVDTDGNVISFRYGHSRHIFAGDVLKIGLDGGLYAVFDTEDVAERYSDVFAFCQWASFGAMFNAFQIHTVH